MEALDKLYHCLNAMRSIAHASSAIRAACSSGQQTRAASTFRGLMLRKTASDTSDSIFSAKVEEIERSALPPGDVIVQVEYSTLNYKDGLAIANKGTSHAATQQPRTGSWMIANACACTQGLRCCPFGTKFL
jgi:hypothetical protein